MFDERKTKHAQPSAYIYQGIRDYMCRLIASMICVVMALQAGCSYWNVNGLTENKTTFDTRVFASEQCIYAAPVDGKRVPMLGAIVAAVLPALIEKSLQRFGVAVRRAGEKSTKSVSGTVNAEMAATEMPSCFQIIVGTFYVDQSRFTEERFESVTPLPFSAIADSKSTFSKLKTIGAYLADKPIMFFEGRVKRSEDGTAIAIGPTMLVYDSTLESRDDDRKKGTRDLVLSFAITSPASQDKGVIAQIIFSKQATGTVLKFDGVVPETPWIPIQLTETKSPRTITLTVSETKDANEFLLFIADVLDGSKEGVETALKQTLIESERSKIKQQEIVAERQKQVDETKAVGDAVEAESSARIAIITYRAVKDVAESDPSKRPELIQKAAEAFKKMLDANLKARNVGQAPPFRDDVLGSVKQDISGK